MLEAAFLFVFGLFAKVTKIFLLKAAVAEPVGRGIRLARGVPAWPTTVGVAILRIDGPFLRRADEGSAAAPSLAFLDESDGRSPRGDGLRHPSSAGCPPNFL